MLPGKSSWSFFIIAIWCLKMAESRFEKMSSSVWLSTNKSGESLLPECSLVPFWSSRLGKNELKALQISKRGGELSCQLENDRVLIQGKAVKYLEGTIELSISNHE